MRRFLSTLLAALCLTLAACTSNPISGLLVTKSAKEREIATLRADYEAKIATARIEVGAAKDRVIAGKDDQMVRAAGSFVAQGLVFNAIAQPTRTDLLFRNYATEGHAAIGNVQPTAESLRQIAERVATERDEARTSLSLLQSNHQRVVTENTALAEQTRKHQVELAALQTRLAGVEKEAGEKIAAKQGELIAVQGRLIAEEKARADDRAALQALKTRFSIILGVLALAGIAGAIYSPIGKRECALFGVVCGLAAIGIWWIQPWHVAVAVGVGLVALVAWMLAKHRKDERVADSLTLAMQDLKDRGGDLWAQVRPAVEDRLKIYRKRGGKMVAEKDHAIEQHIDAKLAEYDALPTRTT